MGKEISVIVPVYNGEKYIHTFMKNIAAQNCFNQLLIIVVDDGSNDNSNAILHHYVQKYSENMHLITKQNGGVSSARNAGLDAVTTEYFAFADIDDLMHPALFNTLYRLLKTSMSDMIYSGISKISVGESETINTKSIDDKIRSDSQGEVLTYSSEDAIRILLKNPELNAVCGKMYRYSKLGYVRFDERLAIAEDKLFVFRCLEQCIRVLGLSDDMYYYVQQPVSAMSYVNARKKLGQDIVLDIIDEKIRIMYPETYPLCSAIRARIHAGSYIKVVSNDKDYKKKCEYYRRSVCACPLKYIFAEESGSASIRIMLVKFLPFVFQIIRFKNRNQLL